MSSMMEKSRETFFGQPWTRSEDISEEKIMKYFSLTIIASAEPNQHWTQNRLDELGGDFQLRFMKMDYNRGLNIRMKL